MKNTRKLLALLMALILALGCLAAWADGAATVTYADDHCVIPYWYGNNIATQVAWSREATALRLNPFQIKSGYAFTGWNTASDGTGTPYKDAASYYFAYTNTVTLYAQWRRANVKLTLTEADAISKSGKKQALEATLTKDGQPVEGEYVLFSFGEKTKRDKTNKNGVATWNFSPSALKKLTAGSKMEVTATYGGTTVRKWVKIVE